MALGKLFMIKQSFIISKIYKQNLVVWNRVSFSINAPPIARHFSKTLWITFGCYTDCSFSRGRSIILAILFQIPPRSKILHIFIKIYQNLHDFERYSSGNNELKLYVRCLNLRYIPCKASR